MTDLEEKIFFKILKEVEFDEDEFTWMFLYSFIIIHFPDFEIDDVRYSDEMEILHDALCDVFKFVKRKNKFDKSILKLVEE